MYTHIHTCMLMCKHAWLQPHEWLCIVLVFVHMECSCGGDEWQHGGEELVNSVDEWKEMTLCFGGKHVQKACDAFPETFKVGCMRVCVYTYTDGL